MEAAGTSGRFFLSHDRPVFWWTLALSTGAVAASVLYYASKRVDTIVPFEVYTENSYTERISNVAPRVSSRVLYES